MSIFSCHRCFKDNCSLEEVIDHCVLKHSDSELKYKEKVLDERRGVFAYQTKVHENIIPNDLERLGKKIIVQNNTVLIKDLNSKKKRLSTPVKIKNISEDEYVCAYCNQKRDTLNKIVNHSVETHRHNVLKYHKRSVDLSSKEYGYITKVHEAIIPSVIESNDKKIQVLNNNVHITSSQYKNSQRKLQYAEPETTADFFAEKIPENVSEFLCDGDSEDQDEAVEEMHSLIPSVMETLKENGLINSYIKFNRLLSTNRLPLNNICFLLFLDVVDWFDCETTTHMSYRKETVKFWQIGYRMFHGKFLRFMSGLRNFGQLLDGETDKGYFNPDDSRINFAVPARNNLFKSDREDKLVYPGICFENINALAKRFNDMPMKLCVDGKKICRGKGKVMGDIDCWGFESNPPLSVKKSDHETEINTISDIQSRLDTIVQNGKHGTLTDIINQETESKQMILDLKYLTKRLAETNKLLREKATILVRVEEKFKTLGGQQWMKSRYYPVICSVRTERSEVKSLLEESLSITNKLGLFASSINGCQLLYKSENTINMTTQGNYYKLNDLSTTVNTRHIKQRTTRWMDIRNEAIVTGSTCNKALALGKLKDQQAHYDKVILNKIIPETGKTNNIESRMQFGTEHEIDAIGTLCGKVLPMFYPDLKYYEEGCIEIEYREMSSFMVVSPDGSLRSSENSPVRLAFETKCKAPDSFSPTAYYTIPHYYVTQVLCEMYACGCEELIFTCWSLQSMTVFHVQFDASLWERCWSELVKTYYTETRTRPKKFSEESKALKEEVKQFCSRNVTLIAEFPSSKALRNIEENSSDGNVYASPLDDHRDITEITINELQESLAIIKSWHSRSFQQLRNVATEILVFMLSDLNRTFHMEQENSHVVAYAMKGPSLKNSILRDMMREVIKECEHNNLKVVVTSSDGQWHQYGVRDDQDYPLTIHQLQRQHWAKVRSLDKAKILSRIRNMCIVRTLDDVAYDIQYCRIVVNGHLRDTPVTRRGISKGSDKSNTESNTERSQDTDEIEEEANSSSQHQPDVTSTSISLGGCLMPEFNNYDSNTMDEIDKIYQEYDMGVSKQKEMPLGMDPCQYQPDNMYADISKNLNNLSLNGENSFLDLLENDQFELHDHSNYAVETPSLLDENSTTALAMDTSIVLNTAHNTLYTFNEVPYTEDRITHISESELIIDSGNTIDRDTTSAMPEDNIIVNCVCDQDTVTQSNESQSLIQSLNYEVYSQMLCALRFDSKACAIHNWENMTIDNFISNCRTKATMERALQKHEVLVCVKTIQKGYPDLIIKSSYPKYRLMQILFDEPVPRITTYNEDASGGVHTRRKMLSLKQLSWRVVKGIPKDILSVAWAEHEWRDVLAEWRSKGPLSSKVEIDGINDETEWFSQPRIDTDGLLRFHFTDACHILTCLRSKLCTSGIKGLRREAWEKAAMSIDTNLNISVIVDCIDKQDVALARRVFDTDVEKNMIENGYLVEAYFCKIIRQWFDCEDEPSIPALERCKRRLELRKWLLHGYECGQFPPPTRYVRGIPIVTYEALLSHLERKIQLYAFVPGSKYNVRATGTQEVEQLFSSFRDMDPTGTGTPKPDAIPQMLSVAIEIDNIRLNPDRPFYIKTSKAEVYQSHSLLPSGDETVQKNFLRTCGNETRNGPIYVEDHQFDKPDRSRRKHKRSSGKISKPSDPAHGERGVRQYHKRDDSKIPAHRRLGLLDLPDC